MGWEIVCFEVARVEFSQLLPSQDLDLFSAWTSMLDLLKEKMYVADLEFSLLQTMSLNKSRSVPNPRPTMPAPLAVQEIVCKRV